jgi:hypothetical protein
MLAFCRFLVWESVLLRILGSDRRPCVGTYGFRYVGADWIPTLRIRLSVFNRNSDNFLVEFLRNPMGFHRNLGRNRSVLVGSDYRIE